MISDWPESSFSQGIHTDVKARFVYTYLMFMCLSIIEADIKPALRAGYLLGMWDGM